MIAQNKRRGIGECWNDYGKHKGSGCQKLQLRTKRDMKQGMRVTLSRMAVAV